MKTIIEYNDTTDVDVFEIKSATYAGNFVIHIVFSDGAGRYVDFKPFLKNGALHPSIRKYRNEDQFQQFIILDGNLNWNDYEMIFPLEELYDGQIKN